MILELLFWFLFCYVLMSFAEYIAHRYTMHRRFWFMSVAFERHAIIHHGHFYKNFENDPDPVAKHVNVDMSPADNLLMGLPIWLPLAYFSIVGGVMLVAFIFLHAVLWTSIHREMHDPTGKWFAKYRLYKFYREWHKIHHDHQGSNFNVVFLPLADLVFGTCRWPGTLSRPTKQDYLNEE